MRAIALSLVTYVDGQYAQKLSLLGQIQNQAMSHDKELFGQSTTAYLKSAFSLYRDRKIPLESDAIEIQQLSQCR